MQEKILRAFHSCVCARTHEHRVGSLCTKNSNNNNGGFSGFLKVGSARTFLRISQRKDPLVAMGLSACRSCRPDEGAGRYCLETATLAAAVISTNPNTALIAPTGATPTAIPPSAAPISEPADMAETMRRAPSLVSIAPDCQ